VCACVCVWGGGVTAMSPPFRCPIAVPPLRVWRVQTQATVEQILWHIHDSQGYILVFACDCKSFTPLGLSPLRAEARSDSGHCRANMAHTCQSRPYSGFGFQVKVLNTGKAVSSSRGSGWAHTLHGLETQHCPTATPPHVQGPFRCPTHSERARQIERERERA
jgi:hypothetical protein